MHESLFQDLLVLLGFSVIVVFILQRFKLPSILGFLLTGVIIGPYGLSLVKGVHQVETISEIGVILLLFVIGMELSIKQLASIRKTVFIGGFIQVGLTVAATSIIYKLLGRSWGESVFVGFLFSLSSTAIVLKILQERNEISAPHGRNALGILIFQDIIVVPMMLVTPILAGQSTNLVVSISELLIKSVLVVIGTYISAKYIVPRFLYLIVKTNSKELFLLAQLPCVLPSHITSSAGLSLALGAFIAGLIISESDYSHQATGTILPFRELFTSFFFISVGMLLDLSFFIKNAPIILFLVLGVLILKTAIAAIATASLKYPPRTVFLTGFALFQIGEFSFILSKVGIEYKLLSPEVNQYFLSVSIITMLLTPFVIMYSEKITALMISSRMQKKWGILNTQAQKKEQDKKYELDDHLVIIGYGINGTNVAKAAQYAKIPYVILELDAEIVAHEKKKGKPIVYGDAIHAHILEAVHLNKARVVVIAISDPQATKAIIANIRDISQSVYIIVRTRYVKEIAPLTALGADEVIPEEFETSIEIFSHVLHNYLIPMDEIENFIDTIRADDYKLFRSPNKLPRTISSTRIPDFKITCVRLMADSGDIIGKTISEVDVRKNFGINILAILRKGKMIESVSPDEKLIQNDLIFISGDQENIEQFYRAVV
ncbi:MAG: cation:proton antiporter [Saprospiraceae bacterium]|nr:cation:proton antiporter [Saprospiraceae bacterium]